MAMTLCEFFERGVVNFNISINDLTEVEQTELKADILKEVRAFRQVLVDFVSTLDCKYTELASKITEFARTCDGASFWVEDDGTELGVDGWLDIYSDLYSINISLGEDGKFVVATEVELEFDMYCDGTDVFVFVDTESGTFTKE